MIWGRPCCVAHHVQASQHGTLRSRSKDEEVVQTQLETPLLLEAESRQGEDLGHFGGIETMVLVSLHSVKHSQPNPDLEDAVYCRRRSGDDEPATRNKRLRDSRRPLTKLSLGEVLDYREHDDGVEKLTIVEGLRKAAQSALVLAFDPSLALEHVDAHPGGNAGLPESKQGSVCAAHIEDTTTGRDPR